MFDMVLNTSLIDNNDYLDSSRDVARAAARSKIEIFKIIVNGFHPFTIIKKCSILDVAAVLDPPLSSSYETYYYKFSQQPLCKQYEANKSFFFSSEKNTSTNWI